MTTVASFDDYARQCQGLLGRVETGCLAAAVDLLEVAYRADRTVFACGNGGSAANASHFVEDLAKLMWHEASGARFKAQSLADPAPFVMALANDDGYERIFEIQLAVQSTPGDVLVCISGSGNSPNVLRAARWARDHGLPTVGLTGYEGGELASGCDVHIHVPSHNMGMLEVVHLAILDYMGKELRWRARGVERAAR